MKGSLSREGKLRIHREVMPQIHRHILRFDKRWHHLQHVEMLGQLDQLAKIAAGAGAPPAFKIGGVGCAGTRLEDQCTQLQQNIAVRACGSAQD